MPGICRISIQSSGQTAPAPAANAVAHGWRLACAPTPQQAPATTRLGCLAAGRTSTFTQLPITAMHFEQHVVMSLAPCGVAVSARDSCCLGVASNSSLRRRPFTAVKGPGAAAPARLARTPAAVPELLAPLAASPYRDYYVVAGAAVGAAVWVKFFDMLAANGTLDQKLSRKLVHTTTGPIFVITWALFSAAPAARYLAAVVPMLNFARLVSVGSGLLSDPGLVNSVSRSGDRGELLKGPLFYVVTLVAATVLCWRDNPAGLIAVAMMCGGDGLADIVGRRWGAGAKLPYNKSKSWAGSIAMLVGGYGMSYGLIVLFCELGFFACYPPGAMLSCLGAIALAATVVESLPINQFVDDNVSVPVVAAVLSMLLLPQPAEAVVAAVTAAAPVAGLAVTAAATAAATPVAGLVL
ncbi:hypothetical protein PLESTB_001373600 [Pleodorina starrii]|uniref:phytol kinase n=1 Tax=Pleodorina starrii TaxID=330485 RepID=A0A9W6BW05_9CHLO|nr:hypothetical protein PLESTM_000411500 [Pleodorina starrii]GLC58551.1 hypothetical protein PLESTB_001373600 [Pleodorina starrii]GLC74204.1 hypothetical protein PLESTF_001473400 [Pleodorina starrii]